MTDLVFTGEGWPKIDQFNEYMERNAGGLERLLVRVMLQTVRNTHSL